MKLIAKAEADNFIVEMNKDEIAHIAGFSSVYKMKGSIGFSVGDVFDVADIYDKAKWVLEAYGEIKSSIDKVRRTSTNLIRLCQKKELIADNHLEELSK